MEKHVLNTASRPTWLVWGVSLLGALLLSACGTPVTQRQANLGSALDMDTLLHSSPTAAGAPRSASTAPRHLSTQDPTSGLRVDIGAAALSTATADQPEAMRQPPAIVASPLSAQPHGVAATTVGNDEDDKPAVGTVSDPLRPDAPIDLSDVSANSDLWARIRSGFQLTAPDTSLVADHERWYASRPDYVQRMTERSNRYLFHVVDEIQRRQMPTELALLPFIESAFNPQAMSTARASGMWQFMPATGKTFELKQNLFRDERRDVLASTRAALDYLQKLYRQFGDWHLALAAYNWGEGNLQRAIQRNQRQGLPTDYLSLNMPAETRNYVPKLHAVKHIIDHPENFGLALPPIENHPYFVSVPLKRDMDVTQAARLAGLPLDEFKALNPSLNKPVILAAGTPQVLLPYDNAGLFVSNLGQHKGPLASWTAWVVPRTMRPAEAAKEVGMTEQTLKDINHIPAKMLVKAGSTLVVPRAAHREQDVSEALADNATMNLAPDLPPLRKVSMKAGKRDTLATMAKRMRVNPNQLAQWNRMNAGASLKPGQTLVAFVPAAANARGGVKQANVAAASQLNNSKRGRPVMLAKATPAQRPAVSRAVARNKPSAPSRNGRVKVASAH